MNDAEFEEVRSRFQPIVESLANRLRLPQSLQEFEVVYDRDSDGMSTQGEGYRGSLGITTTHWEYKRATIRFDLSKVGEMDDEMLEYVALHEMMHVYLQQTIDAFAEEGRITEIQGKHVERTATDLAQAIQWAIKG